MSSYPELVTVGLVLALVVALFPAGWMRLSSVRCSTSKKIFSKNMKKKKIFYKQY